ncbi:MAG TPA: tRNA (N6-isopentenyl adenosine(37)-C2)-methylthiotransferase MiaB [Chitinivibrionales bacterium]|nr:tRNA (N6-isopentenyl adenosine(37)-C2)-methylthiotransferase MiaB [Chitinivibrionales bacterium]
MPFVFFETFGCQMNVADSDALAAVLLERGFAKTERAADADLIVINTCSVREHAEQRALAHIAEHAAHKRQRKKNQKIWVVGCMAQRMGEKLRHDFPGVDRVIGARDFEKFVQGIDTALAAPKPAKKGAHEENAVSRFVPIMRGCDNRCAYCVVPQVRGPEVSLPALRIEDAVRSLVDKGAKEVTLLGQNVNSYHDGGTNFPGLLRRIHSIDGLERIRFTTSHPKDCSEELVRAMAELPKLCKHLHLPVQSGSSRVLGLMNRKYDRERYLRLIDMIRHHVPGIDITTDVMVGFPTEAENDFSDTVSLFKAVRFTAAFMFEYSKRDNTPAASMGDDVAQNVKQRRLRELIDLQTAITKRHYAAMEEKTVPVLFTGRQDGGEKLWMGQDFGCKRVLAACNDSLAGMILPMRVLHSTGMTLVCERT